MNHDDDEMEGENDVQQWARLNQRGSVPVETEDEPENDVQRWARENQRGEFAPNAYGPPPQPTAAPAMPQQSMPGGPPPGAPGAGGGQFQFMGGQGGYHPMRAGVPRGFARAARRFNMPLLPRFPGGNRFGTGAPAGTPAANAGGGAPPLPGPEGPIDPQILRQVQEAEAAIPMIQGRDDVSDSQKQHMLGQVNATLQRLDPRGQYRKGSMLRSQSQAEQWAMQNIFQDPRTGRVFYHDGRTWKEGHPQKQEQQPPPVRPFGQHVLEETGRSHEDWFKSGVAVNRDAKGTLHFHNLPQQKPERHPEDEARDKRIMHTFEQLMKQTESKDVADKNGGKTTTTNPRYKAEDAMRLAHEMERIHQDETRKAKNRMSNDELIGHLGALDPAERDAADRARAAEQNAGTQPALPQNFDDLMRALPGGQ